MLRELAQKFNPFRRRSTYGQTYLAELEYQAGLMFPFAIAIAFFNWLPYIASDMEILSGKRTILYLRLGLTLMAIVCGLLYLILRHRYRSLICGGILIFYLEVATGIITGLTGVRPEYMGGYLLVLMLLPIIPFPPWMLLGSIACSIVAFALSSMLIHVDLENSVLRYSLQDFISTVFIVTVFIFVLNKIRYRSWGKSRTIEKLLLNILPPSIAAELQENGFVLPRKFESSTVVFTDFAGFTSISESLSPERLIDELHHIFRKFDQIVEQFGLEKLKTIGDSYMYAGGIPDFKASHVVDAILAAIEMQLFIRQHNESRADQLGTFCWKMRLGISSGPVMAGIVGERKYVYDVFGSTVNMASRLETSGAVDAINVSEATAAVVRDFFAIEYRGELGAKGLGLIKMYFVEGFHPNLAEPGQPFEPNEHFFALYASRFGRDLTALYRPSRPGFLQETRLRQAGESSSQPKVESA